MAGVQCAQRKGGQHLVKLDEPPFEKPDGSWHFALWCNACGAQAEIAVQAKDIYWFWAPRPATE